MSSHSIAHGRYHVAVASHSLDWKIRGWTGTGQRKNIAESMHILQLDGLFLQLLRDGFIIERPL